MYKRDLKIRKILKSEYNLNIRKTQHKIYFNFAMFTASEKEPHWYRDNILIVSVLTSFPTNSSEQDSAIQLRASWTPDPFFTSPTLSTRSPSTKPADTLVNTVFLPRWASRSIFNFSTCYKKIKFSPLLPWFKTNLSFKQFFSIKITFILYQFVFIGSVREFFNYVLPGSYCPWFLVFWPEFSPQPVSLVPLCSSPSQSTSIYLVYIYVNLSLQWWHYWIIFF